MQQQSFGFIKNSRHGRRMLMLRWVLFVLIIGIVLLLTLLSWQDQIDRTDQIDQIDQTPHAWGCGQPSVPAKCLHKLV